MEESNELKDIVLEDRDENSSSKKMRKILVGVAILVIIFLIVIFVMKILNTPADKQSDTRMLIPPEIETSSDKIFEQVPIVKDDDSSKNKESFDDIVKSLKQKEEIRQRESSDINLSKTNEVAQNKVKIEPKTEPTPEKKEVTIAKKPDSKKQKPKVQIEQNDLKKGAYIQVMALSKIDPKNQFFKSLKDNGYKYTQYKTEVNGNKVIKILVGPYNNNQIEAELKKIKEKVSKNAFIFRVD